MTILILLKKDKLKKTKQALAEKHFNDFGESIWQLKKGSNNHNLYLPCSSFFPSNILSLLLNQLLIIHFPAQLEDIVKKTWLHYPKYQNLLFDLLITIQTLIVTQQTNKQAATNTKWCNRQHEATNIPDEDSSCLPSPECVPIITEPVNALVTRKWVATEDTTNTAKRQQAPCAVQLSMAEASKEFRPQYHMHHHNIVTASSAEKENEPQVTWSSACLQGLN